MTGDATDRMHPPTSHRRSTRGRRIALSAVAASLAVTTAAVAIQATTHARRGGTPDASFTIARDLWRPLQLGSSRGLNLRLKNPHPYALEIRRITLTVEIDAAHRAAGCRVGRDVVAKQLPATAYPIRLRARSRLSLRDLRVRGVPRIEMPNLPTVNQDACKGARFTLRYTGSSRAVTKAGR